MPLYTQTQLVTANGTGSLLVNAATTTGTAVSQHFGVSPGTYVVTIFSAGTFSVGTADLEVSIDGGTTFVAVTGQTGFDLTMGPIQLNVTTGPTYRLNVKSFTGTSVTVTGYVGQ